MEMVLSMEAAKSRNDTVARLIVTKSLLINGVEHSTSSLDTRITSASAKAQPAFTAITDLFPGVAVSDMLQMT